MQKHQVENNRFGSIIASFTRRVRFPGRERLLRRLFPPENFRTNFIAPQLVENYDGNLKIMCDLGSYIEWSIYFKAYYAPDLSLAIKKLTRPGMVVFDIGANIGAYTLLMAKEVGTEGKIFSFEPNPEVRERLRSNVMFNQFSERVEIVKLALSDTSGNAQLYIPRPDIINRGVGSLQEIAGFPSDKISVQVDSLDAFVNSADVDKLDFIKIDTEGYDAKIIRGGKQTIERYRPIILFEVNFLAHQKANEDIDSIREMLVRLGYRFFTVGYFGHLKALPFGARLPDADIICISEV